MKQQFLAMIDKKIDSIKWTIWSEWTGSNMIYILEKLRSDVEKMEDNIVSKTDALSFAYWYHSWLTNGERWPVEEEFEKYMNETI